MLFTEHSLFASGHGEANAETNTKASKEEKPKKRYNVIKLDPITVPVLQGGEVKSYYSFILDIGIKDESKYEHANSNAPRIIDSIVTQLYIVFNLIWRKEIGDDLTMIEERLIKAVNSVLGGDIIKNIYLNSAKKAKDETINDIRKRG